MTDSAKPVPATMSCVEITEPGGPEVLRLGERATPQPRSGEVLVRVVAAGVNRPDVLQRQGGYPPPPGASDIPGLEIAGQVVACGAEVAWPQVGDWVCALVSGGGYAQYCTAPAAQCLPLPEGLTPVQAASLPETFFTVWSNLIDRARFQAGERVLVHGGSSGIGVSAIQLLTALGGEVVSTVGSEDKRQACLDLGAAMVINYREQDFVAEVKAFTAGAGVDIVLDMVGGDYIQRNLSCLASDGRMVSIAFLRGSTAEVNFLPVMLKRLTLTGSTLRARDIRFKGAIAQALRQTVWPLLGTGQIKPVIAAQFPLDQASQAHALMETSQHIGKIMLRLE